MLALLVAVLLWGLAPVATRYLVGVIDPLPLLGIRFAIATLVCLPLAIGSGVARWPRRDRWVLLLCALLGVTGYYLPTTVGARWTSAGTTGLVLATEPLLILLAWSIRDRRRPSLLAVGGGLVAFGGVALLVGNPASAATAGLRFLGPLLVLGGALSWSIYCVAVSDIARRYGTVSITIGTTVLGAVPLLVLGTGGATHAARVLGGSGWLVLIALTVGSTIFGTLFWNYGLGHLRGPRPGAFLYLVPLFSVLGGHFLLQEQLTAGLLLGGSLVVGGVALSQVTRRRALVLIRGNRSARLAPRIRVRALAPRDQVTVGASDHGGDHPVGAARKRHRA